MPMKYIKTGSLPRSAVNDPALNKALEQLDEELNKIARVFIDWTDASQDFKTSGTLEAGNATLGTLGCGTLTPGNIQLGNNYLYFDGGTTYYLRHSGTNVVCACEGYFEILPNSDTYGLIIRDMGSSEYGNIKNVNGVTYIGDGTSANADMVAINGQNVTLPGNLSMSSATSKIIGGTYLRLNAGTQGVQSYTVYNDTTASAATIYMQTAGDNKYAFYRKTSAKKYKDKVKDIELDSSLIYNLRPISFNSLGKADDKDKRWIGLIADEVEQIYPEIIDYNNKGEVEGYDNQMLMTLMLTEEQKLHQQIITLEKRVKQLEDQSEDN